ncbi:hypothetical protein S245_071198, partial [Arachis hypogaea]
LEDCTLISNGFQVHVQQSAGADDTAEGGLSRPVVVPPKRLQQVRLNLPYSIILLNSSNEVVQSVAFESKRAETCLNSSISRSKREDKLANATKNTRFFFPLGVPSYKQ